MDPKNCEMDVNKARKLLVSYICKSIYSNVDTETITDISLVDGFHRCLVYDHDITRNENLLQKHITFKYHCVDCEVFTKENCPLHVGVITLLENEKGCTEMEFYEKLEKMEEYTDLVVCQDAILRFYHSTAYKTVHGFVNKSTIWKHVRGLLSKKQFTEALDLGVRIGKFKHRRGRYTYNFEEESV